MVAPHVGGAFGGKAGIGYHHGAIVAAARALGRPVAWTETRSEAMLSMHGRAAVQFAELGLTRDGRITGLRARNVGDCGAYAGFGGTLVVGPGHIMAQGPYEIPKIEYSAIAAMTNTAPNGAFRGAGRPEAAAMLERLMDLAAVELGLTPEEIRRRNLIPKDAFPYKTLTGLTYDVGDYEAALQEALRLADVDALRAEQAPPDRGRRGEAARHRRLDVRRDHRLRRQGARQRADRAGRLGHGDVRHVRARPGPRHVVRDDRGRPARHPDRADPLRAVRHPGGAHRRRHRRLALTAARWQRRRGRGSRGP